MVITEPPETRLGASDDWLSCANSAMCTITSALTDAPFAAAIEALNRFRDELNSVEALLIAQRKGAGHSDRATEGIITNSGGVSKAEAKRRNRRGAVVLENPQLAQSLTSGSLSTEQIDLVADASARTDGAAAHDDRLIRNIAALNPDQGRSVVRRFVEDHESQGDRDTRHSWQRARRKVYRHRTNSGLSQLIIEGDDHSVGTMLRALRRRADAMYRADGGRDVPGHKHRRTHEQRLFDAAVSQINGTVEVSAARPASGSRSTTPSSSSSPMNTGADRPSNRPGERPSMVFTAKLSEISDDPDQHAAWTAELIGQGVVPTSVASYFRCISNHAAMLLDESGAVLWKGRSIRRVTPEQWTALVTRDGGCVLCQADHTTCEAHHLIPWESPKKGETNIDAVALLCVDCHHRVHENLQTLYLDAGTKRWQLRRARSDEIPRTGNRVATQVQPVQRE